MSNFDSVYNTAPHHIHHPTIYVPISSSTRSSNPRFNLDLYQPNEYHSQSFDYPSPSSSVILHHHHHQPVYSPPPSQAISKLRQINDELCYTLAQCELTTQSQPPPPPPLQQQQQRHLRHHHPVTHHIYHSRSPSQRDSSSSSSSAESEPIIKKRNARMTYKAHIPRRPNSLSKVDQLLISTSDAYSPDDPMTIDLYPTHGQGFIKRVKNRPDNQKPWLADTSPIRRNSYSEANSYRTPRAPYYDGRPLQPNSRLTNGKERPLSSSVKSRVRRDSAPNSLRRSSVVFASTGPTWRPNGSIKRPKFIGSNVPSTKPKPLPHEPTWNPAGAVKKTKRVRAFDPVSKPSPAKIIEPTWNPAGLANKTKPFRAMDPVSKPQPVKINEPVWNPPSTGSPKKPPKYFEPTLKPELTAPIRKITAPVVQRNPPTIRSGDPKLKTRLANAESKVKSAWEATAAVKEPKPPIPRPVKKTTTPIPRPAKKTTTPIPPKPKGKPVPTKPIVPVKKVVPAPVTTTNTDRSTVDDFAPKFYSSPRNQSIVDKNDGGIADVFDDESQISQPPIEKTPPKITAPQPDRGTKSTIKNGVLVQGDDANDIRSRKQILTPPLKTKNNNDEDELLTNRSFQPSPILPVGKESSAKPNYRDDVSIIDDEELNETNAEVEPTSEADKPLDDVSKAPTNTSPKAKTISPLTPLPALSKPDIKTPPPRKGRSPPATPNQELSQSLANSEPNNQQSQITTPVPLPDTNEVDDDDFFN